MLQHAYRKWLVTSAFQWSFHPFH